MGTFYWTLSFGPENKHRSSIKNNVRSVKMETDLRPNKAELARLSGFDLRFKFFHFVTYEY